MPALGPFQKLTQLCTAYRARLVRDVERLVDKEFSPEEKLPYMKDGIFDAAAMVKQYSSGGSLKKITYGSDYSKEVSAELKIAIQKLRIVNNMLTAAEDKKQPDEMMRLQEMAKFLTPANQNILAQNRSTGPGATFVKTVLDSLSRAFNKDLKFKTTGTQLAEQVLKIKEQLEKERAKAPQVEKDTGSRFKR